MTSSAAAVIAPRDFASTVICDSGAFAPASVSCTAVIGVMTMSSWSCAPLLPFGVSTPIDVEVDAVELHGRADRVLRAEQVGHHGLTEQRDPVAVRHVVVRERRALGDGVVADREVVGVGADELAGE